jgi:hypothetical protein
MASDRLSTKRTMNEQLIGRLQDRVADLAIGNSTLRNQGAKGVARIARRLLKKIKLDAYKCKSRKQFLGRLNNDTKEMKDNLPDGAKHWGTARKALNIFLRNVVYNVYLREHFCLGGIVSWLELPLDSYTMDGLRAEKEGAQLPKHSTIKHMDESLNARFQNVAQEVANRMGTRAVHLDLLYWRDAKRKSNSRTHSKTERKRPPRR